MRPIATYALAMALVAAPAIACDIGRWQPYIAEASRTYVIPETWIRAVMRAESAGCTHWQGRLITSSAGAMGLMQLMPATWAELRQRHGLGADPHDPRDNILAGTAYLRELVDAFGVPGAFAAYHAGPGRYAAHRRYGQPLPAQTRRYLTQVSSAVSAASMTGTTDRGAVPAADTLFAVDARKKRSADETRESSDARLFVKLREAAADVSFIPPEHSHAQN